MHFGYSAFWVWLQKFLMDWLQPQPDDEENLPEENTPEPEPEEGNEENLPRNENLPKFETPPPPPKKETMNFRNDITIILSAGHGATDPLTGEYHCLAGGKEYTYRDGRNVREGDLNRLYAKSLEKSLLEAGYKVVNVHHEIQDYSLDKRIKLAQEVKGECCLIPIHHNASVRHNAKGFEVFTTRGKTPSDDLAEYIWFKVNLLRRMFKNLRMRHDIATDGDHDKEANFKEIKHFENYHKNTAFTGACAYIENGFFDYKPDLERIENKDFLRHFTIAVVKAIDLFYKK